MKINSLSTVMTVDKNDCPKKQEANPKKAESYSIANSLKLEVKKSNIPAVDLKKEPEKDNLDVVLDTTNKVTTGLSAIGTMTTVPGEIIRNAGTVKNICNSVIIGSAVNVVSSAPNSIKEKALVTVARTAGKAIRLTDGLTVVAARYNSNRTYDTMTKKVLPVANGIVSGISIYSNAKKFNKAQKEGNKLEMVKTGTQIALNTVSGVTGFIPGTGQTVSAVAGITSIFSDFAITKTAKLFTKK